MDGKFPTQLIFSEVVAIVYNPGENISYVYVKTDSDIYYKFTVIKDRIRDENNSLVKGWNECQTEDIIAESFRSSGFKWVHRGVSDQDDHVKNHKSLGDIILLCLLVNAMNYLHHS